ncbi:MAG: hypothetical protein ACKVU1_10575 [bacterium]
MAHRNHRKQCVLCISNRGYRAALLPRRIYVSLADPEAAALGLVRVVDESGEDYLFPAKLFTAIEVPKEASKLFKVAN